MDISFTQIFHRVNLIAALGLATFFSSAARADVLNVDLTGVDPAYHEAFRMAEARWEARIQNYSNDLPNAILVQLTRLTIFCSTPVLDGPGGVLGAASVTSMLTFEGGTLFAPKSYSVSTGGTLVLDLEDLPGLVSDGILETVIAHEIAHAMGMGSLWVDNDLIAPVGGVGLVQYTGGKYALRGHRLETNNPIAPFVAIEQRGGGGTALSHWADLPPFFNQVFTPARKKEIMTGFACDVVPSTGEVICAEKFVSNATWGSFADLGYEVKGINDNTSPPPTGRGTGRWPKIVGPGIDPFNNNGIPPAAGLRFKLTNIEAVYRGNSQSGNGGNPNGGGTARGNDPYGLRNQRWVN